MKRTLADEGIRLTKSLGQHFLHDGNQLRRIVAAARLEPADRVLEIGPGLGPLTGLLIGQAGMVLAIEKDGRLVEFLEKQFAGRVEAAHELDPRGGVPAERRQVLNGEPAALDPDAPTPGCMAPTGGSRTAEVSHQADPPPRLRLLHADALEFLRETPRDWSAWKVVANLPYSVGSPILVELAESPGPPQQMVVTLQLEVAQRLTAQAGDADYGVLSLLIQLRYEAAGFFRIPRTCFHPAPEVDSACITLLRRPRPLLEARRAAVFTRLVKRGFCQRRKMMLKLLKTDWPARQLEASFERLGLSRHVRAEAVSLEQFLRLAETLAQPEETPPAFP